MNQDNTTYCLSQLIVANKIFSYKGQEYQVDFDLIKKNSSYFQDRKFKKQNKIDLQEIIDISNEDFQIFLDCCQNKPFKILDSNVFILNYLAVKYEVAQLRNYTDKYIEDNHMKLIFQSMYFKQQLREKINLSTNYQNLEFLFLSGKEEQIISSHFSDYINDDRLYSLQIPVLDRIMKLYLNSNQSQIDNDQSIKNHLKDFLFKCLDKYKRKASILFLNIDVKNFDKQIFIKLNNDYFDIFDFNMLNPKSLFQTAYDLMCELTKTQIQFQQFIDQEIVKKINDLEKFRENVQSELVNMHEEQTKLSQKQTSFEEENVKFNSKYQDDLNTLKSSFVSREKLREVFEKGKNALPTNSWRNVSSLEKQNSENYKEMERLRSESNKLSNEYNSFYQKNKPSQYDEDRLRSLKKKSYRSDYEEKEYHELYNKIENLKNIISRESNSYSSKSSYISSQESSAYTRYRNELDSISINAAWSAALCMI